MPFFCFSCLIALDLITIKNVDSDILALFQIAGETIQYFSIKGDVGCMDFIDTLYQVKEVSSTLVF